jgi:hypothetical protein
MKNNCLLSHSWLSLLSESLALIKDAKSLTGTMIAEYKRGREVIVTGLFLWD